eukprot:gene36445-41244_t
MNFQQLRSIREAARRNYNLTEVANALFTSQPGVSRQIRELEDELGVVIFERNGKRLTGLTDPGKGILKIIDRLLVEAENLQQASLEYTGQNSGAIAHRQHQHRPCQHPPPRHTRPPSAAHQRHRVDQTRNQKQPEQRQQRHRSVIRAHEVIDVLDEEGRRYGVQLQDVLALRLVHEIDHHKVRHEGLEQHAAGTGLVFNHHLLAQHLGGSI